MRVIAGLLLLAAAAAQAAEMIELRYQDSEADGTSYPTRILVTEQYLRMDEGSDEADFVLLDRKTRQVVNVLHDRRMIIAMQDRPLPKAPPRAYRVEKKLLPVREGTVRLQVLADGKLCSETVAAARLFPEAVQALAEYGAAMAYTQWVTYRNTPAEMRQDCDLVHYVWQSNYALSEGLPIEQRDYSGRIRKYLDGGKRPLKPELFRLPAGYEEIRLVDPEAEATGINSQPAAVQTR